MGRLPNLKVANFEENRFVAPLLELVAETPKLLAYLRSLEQSMTDGHLETVGEGLELLFPRKFQTLKTSCSVMIHRSQFDLLVSAILGQMVSLKKLDFSRNELASFPAKLACWFV